MCIYVIYVIIYDVYLIYTGSSSQTDRIEHRKMLAKNCNPAGFGLYLPVVRYQPGQTWQPTEPHPLHPTSRGEGVQPAPFTKPSSWTPHPPYVGKLPAPPTFLELTPVMGVSKAGVRAFFGPGACGGPTPQTRHADVQECGAGTRGGGSTPW